MDDSGGFDANFLDPPPNELICPVCTCVVKNPIQISKCGHRLCSVCYISLRKFSKECLCPTDRTVIEDNQVFADIGAGRRVMSLQVKCEYFKKGCVWVGELRELQSHVDQCYYESLEEEYYVDQQDNEVDDQTHLLDKLTKLETSLQLKDAEINGLKHQVEDLTIQLLSSLKTVSTFEEKYSSLSNELNDLRSVKKQLLNTSKALDNKHKCEEVEFGKLKKDLSSNTNKLQSLSSQFNNRIKTINELEGIVEMADKVYSMEHSIQILQTNVNNCCEEINSFKAKQKSDEIESDNLRKDIKKAHNIIQNLTDRFTKTFKKIDNNCTSIKNLEKKIDVYNDVIITQECNNDTGTKAECSEGTKKMKRCYCWTCLEEKANECLGEHLRVANLPDYVVDVLEEKTILEEYLKAKKYFVANVKAKKRIKENMMVKKNLEEKKRLEENLKAKMGLEKLKMQFTDLKFL